MFKPGDTALIVASGKLTKVTTGNRKHQPFVYSTESHPAQGVDTEDGCFLESELQQAHPSVLATANPTEKAPAEALQELVKDDDDSDAADVVAGAKRLLNKITKINSELHFKVAAQLRKTEMADVDLKGHWRNGAAFWSFDSFKKRILADMFVWAFKSDEDAQDLQKALKTKEPMDRWIDLGPCSSSLGHEGCSYCGVKRFHMETNGVALRLTGEPCALPNGFEPNEWELNVPSGKILVANDLRRWFPLPEGDGDIQSVNTVIGCRQTAQAYAAVGMSHAFVGNTCPGVFKLADGSFKIASEPYDDADEETQAAFEGKRVAGICTDLWWYSLCDSDEFDRRLKKFGGTKKDKSIETIDVKPGVYRFRHHDDSSRDHDTSEGETVYATFEWVREADPVKDFLKAWDEVDVNPHAYVQAQVKRWPTLYGAVRNAYRDNENVVPWSEMTEEQRISSWKRVADHIFFVIGGGTDWHEKGFPRSSVDPMVPDIEPPSFRQQNHWYPFSKPYGGLYEPKYLAPSFAKLLFRCLESVISFGMAVRDDATSRDVPYVRQRMQEAVERYRELAKQYPEQADPEYVWWLNQPGRAEAWVKNFDLGPTFTEKHSKNAAAQRWIPEDAYAIEFDARKLKDGHFAWAEGHWAKKEDAERYAIVEWSDNGQKDPRLNCFWASHAKNTAIPLYSVARVVKVGAVSHMGASLIEVAFDYGTSWMTNPKKRKAVAEHGEKAAIRLLTKAEYEKLLPKAKAFEIGKKTGKKVTKLVKKAVKKASKAPKKIGKKTVKKAAKKARKRK